MDISRPSENTENTAELWAYIAHLEAMTKGPDGYPTWRDAAIAERVTRVNMVSVLNTAVIGLGDIADPVRGMVRDLPEGHRLNIDMAMSVCNDASYFKELAISTLNTIRPMLGESDPRYTIDEVGHVRKL